MKVLILDGSSGSDERMRRICDILTGILSERKIVHEIVHLDEKKIVPCTRCGGCWAETPGLCKGEDDTNALNRSWMSSNVVVLLTRMTFGGYSSRIKDVLDKQIGLSLPYVVARGEKVEHEARYLNYPSVLGIAVCDDLRQCDSETFKMIVRQNGRTLRAFHSKALVLWANESDGTVKDLLDSAVLGMKVRQ